MGLRDLPSDAALLDSTARTLLLKTREPAEGLARLTAQGCSHAWLEGGPRLAAAFVRAGLVDEIVAYVAPVLLGSGASAVADLGIDTMGGATRLDLVDVTQVGDDVRLILKGAS